MHDYDAAAQASARVVMNKFSTSFGLATRLFPRVVRQDIYNIYGLVRLADEVVDSYRQKNAGRELDSLEQAVTSALKTGFSTNLIVHAYALTANKYDIEPQLATAFFDSMRMDLRPNAYKPSDYERYIYGSAEVVGLMCLKVFCAGDSTNYEHLIPGARALGSAFQKVNFLRDIASDYDQLGRYYFPVSNFDDFDDSTKNAIITEIRAEFAVAKAAIMQLPKSAQPAVISAYYYYLELLNKLSETPAPRLKKERVRVTNSRKLAIFMRRSVTQKLGLQR